MFSSLTPFFAIATLAITSVRSAQISVTVGGAAGNVYTPNFVNANPGDVVTFNFLQKNHTVTQSSFDTPCAAAPGGFDTGFQPVAATETTGPSAQFTVADTNPVWVYCRQTGHCQQGMVFAINPGSSATLAQFQQNAIASGNATASGTVPAAASGTGVVTVTATVTVGGGQTLTTTYGSYPGSAAPTSAVSTDHQVTVGANGALTYSPSNITAQVGDTVTFTFVAKNHTVTQSNFAVPCRSLTQTSTSGQIGFDSGFMPVGNNTANPTFTIQVNSTAPIWAYCRQTGHCGKGMVFSVNAVAPNTFDAFQQEAMSQNGTTTSTSTAPSSTASSGASQVHAGITLALVGVVAGLVL